MPLLKLCCVYFIQNDHQIYSEGTTVLPTDGCENAHLFGDGMCDDGNNNEECGWDGGDCCGEDANMSSCYVCQCLDHRELTDYGLDSGCNDEWRGDGYCDDCNNFAAYNYDDGDCCGENVNIDYCNGCQCLDPNDGGATETSTSDQIIFTDDPCFYNSCDIMNEVCCIEEFKNKAHAVEWAVKYVFFV